MNTVKTIWFGAVLLIALWVPCLSQTWATSIEKLAYAFEQLIQKEEPGWTFKRIEPVFKDEDVIIEQWSLDTGSVRVSIVPHKSPAQASEVLQNFVRIMKPQERQFDVGEEGYSWGFGGCETVFRKDRFTVYVGAVVNVHEDPAGDERIEAEKAERKSSDQRKLSRKFAKLVASAIEKDK